MEKKTFAHIKKFNLFLVIMQFFFVCVHACPTCIGRKIGSREPFFSKSYYQPKINKPSESQPGEEKTNSKAKNYCTKKNIKKQQQIISTPQGDDHE